MNPEGRFEREFNIQRGGHNRKAEQENQEHGRAIGGINACEVIPTVRTGIIQGERPAALEQMPLPAFWAKAFERLLYQRLCIHGA